MFGIGIVGLTALVAADTATIGNSPTIKVLAVTLYRELQTQDFRLDHELMLSVIVNRAKKADKSMFDVCVEQWQFSYWNRFWRDNKFTLSDAKLDSEFNKVPASFLASMGKTLLERHSFEHIDHFYSPKSMRPKYRVPAWAAGKKPVYETKNFRFYSLNG
jgi:hypothetical protein